MKKDYYYIIGKGFVMKKDYYYIIKGRRNAYSVELVKGFVDDNKMYGYRYIRESKKSRWECTDLTSGLLVVAKKTIDECVKFTIEQEQSINKIKETKAHKDFVALFNRLVKSQQMEDEAEFNAGW